MKGIWPIKLFPGSISRNIRVLSLKRRTKLEVVRKDEDIKMRSYSVLMLYVLRTGLLKYPGFC